MTGREDFYHLLGVGRKATVDELRKAYRRLARKYHPDVNPGDKKAEDHFKKISAAYDVLGDPKKRKVYDRMGYYQETGGSTAPGGQQGARPVDFSGFDFSDMAGGGARARAGASGFRDIFSQVFRQQDAREAYQEPGTDLEYQVQIGFWEAIRGTRIHLTINRFRTCSTCRGQGGTGAEGPCPECKGEGSATRQMGTMQFSVPCARCGGKGRSRKICTACGGDGRRAHPEKLNVAIPAGVPDGLRVRVPAKGNTGPHGGPPGDFYVVVQVKPHPFFERRGDSIYTVVPVTITEASLGTKIEIPTIDRKRALLKIPPGTVAGQKFRLQEKGVQSLRTGKRGDQFVVVRLHVPKIADERSKEILRELARLNPDDPREEIYRNLKV